MEREGSGWAVMSCRHDTFIYQLMIGGDTDAERALAILDFDDMDSVGVNHRELAGLLPLGDSRASSALVVEIPDIACLLERTSLEQRLGPILEAMEWSLSVLTVKTLSTEQMAASAVATAVNPTPASTNRRCRQKTLESKNHAAMRAGRCDASPRSSSVLALSHRSRQLSLSQQSSDE